MSSEPILLEMREVEKTYAAGADAPPVAVLRELNFSIGRGESVAIVGPSGSGKSTLLNLAGTLDRPTRGVVLIEGQDVGKLDELALARLRNRQIGFVFQSHYLLPQCSALENVLIPTLPHPDSGRVQGALDRARRLLGRVGLGDRLDHRPGQLSGGERQRVAVVRALINSPALLLADEPTGALDRASARNLVELLAALNREEGIALILVTHATELARETQRVLELHDGRLRPASGEPTPHPPGASA